MTHNSNNTTSIAPDAKGVTVNDLFYTPMNDFIHFKGTGGNLSRVLVLQQEDDE
jgi:hypothetical protein